MTRRRMDTARAGDIARVVSDSESKLTMLEHSYLLSTAVSAFHLDSYNITDLNSA